VKGSRSAWLVSLPIALAGCLAAHIAAYALATPDAAANHVHGYLGQLPLVGGGALAVVLAAALRHALRGSSGSRPSPLLFAVLPPLAFALQEHVERLGHPALVVLEPTLLVGLALQLPFGLLAWLLARAILRAAEVLGALLVPPPRPWRPAPLRVVARGLVLPRPALATAGSERGPPAPSGIRP
jgi:hypothetical protein